MAVSQKYDDIENDLDAECVIVCFVRNVWQCYELVNKYRVYFKNIKYLGKS